MINVSANKKVIIKGEARILPCKLSVKCKYLSIKCILVANINTLGNKNNNQIFIIIHHMYECKIESLEENPNAAIKL